MNKKEEMDRISKEVFGLENSPLYKYRMDNKAKAVPGEGDLDAKVIFVGEAPGKNEAEKGIPFCGMAGKILDELLSHIGVLRNDVYITNIVKDRPPANRDPSPEEIALYAPFLDRQIETIKPNVIAPLGRYSAHYILERYAELPFIPGISESHGKVFEADMSYGRIKIIPLFHPAVALYNPSRKDELKKDFEVIKDHVSESPDL